MSRQSHSLLIPRSAPYPASVLIFSLQLSLADISQDVLLPLAFSLIQPIRSSSNMLEGRKDGSIAPKSHLSFESLSTYGFPFPLFAHPPSWAPLFLDCEVTLPLPSINPVSGTAAASCHTQSPNALLDCCLVIRLPVLLVTSSSL